MSAILEANGLTLGYGRTEVVHGISFSVPEGGVVALIGANGAGKTTIMRGISGLIPARAGSLKFRGREITGLAPEKIARLGLSQVPEGRQVFQGMTVEENLKLGAYPVRSQAETARRHADVVKRFPRLAERLRQRAGLLSGGEQQMLAVGRALMSAPTVLLLDEPSMGLAPLLIEEVFKIIAGLKAEGRTILLVEQNARAALKVADEAHVIENGRIALSGKAAELAGRPEIAAAYLGGS